MSATAAIAPDPIVDEVVRILRAERDTLEPGPKPTTLPRFGRPGRPALLTKRRDIRRNMIDNTLMCLPGGEYAAYWDRHSRDVLCTELDWGLRDVGVRFLRDVPAASLWDEWGRLGPLVTAAMREATVKAAMRYALGNDDDTPERDW